jgi:pilus assembly protein CpaB
MKPKTMILLVVAVGCGLAASVMTSRLIAERGEQQNDKMVKVLVTKVKIKQFELLKEPQKLFVEKELPEASTPKKCIRSFDELRDKRVTRALSEDTFVMAEDLVSKDLDQIAGQLKPGSRAVAFRVNPECLVGGFVLPGSRVDVLYTLRDGDKPATRTILQNMLVLAVDMKNERDTETRAMLGNTVTMAVWPKEAQDLMLASSTGEIRLVLRPLGEEKAVSVKGSSLDDLKNPRDFGDPNNGGPETGGSTGLGNLVPVPPVPAGPDTPAPTPEPVRSGHILTVIQGENVQRVKFIKGQEGEETPAPKREVVPPTPRTPLGGRTEAPINREVTPGGGNK